MHAALGKKSKAADHLRNVCAHCVNLHINVGEIVWRREGRGEKRSLNQNKKYQCVGGVLHRLVCYPNCAMRKGEELNEPFWRVRQSEITV